MIVRLIADFHFCASHSLVGDRGAHPHDWRLETTVSGTPQDGKIIDLDAFRASVDEEVLKLLEHTDLNTNSYLSAEVRATPTCESLGLFFFNKIRDLLEKFFPENKDIRLTSVLVGISEPGERELGAVRYDF